MKLVNQLFFAAIYFRVHFRGDLFSGIAESHWTMLEQCKVNQLFLAAIYFRVHFRGESFSQTAKSNWIMLEQCRICLLWTFSSQLIFANFSIILTKIAKINRSQK